MFFASFDGSGRPRRSDSYSKNVMAKPRCAFLPECIEGQSGHRSNIFMEISKGRPLCERRTRVGWISRTFTPSMTDPSLRIMPLIMARRSEGSSCQRIPDNFSDGGLEVDSLGVGSAVFFAFPGATFASSGITFWLAFFSPWTVARSLLSVLLSALGLCDFRGHPADLALEPPGPAHGKREEAPPPDWVALHQPGLETVGDLKSQGLCFQPCFRPCSKQGSGFSGAPG